LWTLRFQVGRTSSPRSGLVDDRLEKRPMSVGRYCITNFNMSGFSEAVASSLAFSGIGGVVVGSWPKFFMTSAMILLRSMLGRELSVSSLALVLSEVGGTSNFWASDGGIIVVERSTPSKGTCVCGAGSDIVTIVG
jgi:hypothetical protein